jgi:hypothetical protein
LALSQQCPRHVLCIGGNNPSLSTAAEGRGASVASELERRWNEKLSRVHAIEEELNRIIATPAHSLTLSDRERLMSLGRDLARAWDSPGATAETKKKIIRLLIAEIVVNIGDTLKLIIHWQGGDHTELTVKKEQGWSQSMGHGCRCRQSRCRLGAPKCPTKVSRRC